MKIFPAAALCLALATLGLAGCAGTPVFSTAAEPTTSSLKGIHGIVHGGRQPIVGARVYVFAAENGGPPNPAIQQQRAQGRLNHVTTGAFPTTFDSDKLSYYETTDSTGSFSLTGEYSCNSGDQIYIYVSGGDPGAGTNPYSTLMAVLGSCPGTSTNFATIYPFVTVNEVTTVAAAYAMAGFATDPTTVSANNTIQAEIGIANAFANAGNLVDITSGTARSRTPVGTGYVPQAEINTLADAMAACINTSGNAVATTSPAAPATFSSACSLLLNAAPTISGAPATDTADAMMNLAHNPSAGGNANAATIYNMVQSVGAPFQPTLSVNPAPQEWTLAVSYVSTSGGTAALAIDASGNIWSTAYTRNFVQEMSPLGVNLSPATSPGTGYFDGGMTNPQALAFDTNGSLWVANNGGSTVSELNSDGSAAAGSPFTPNSSGTNYPLTNPSGIAVDGANHVWVTSGGDPNTPVAGTTYVTVLGNSSGTCAAAGCPKLAVAAPQGIAIDASNKAWIANSTGDCFSSAIFSTSHTPAVYSGGQPCQADFNGSLAVAIDSSGTKWITESGANTITSVTSSGTITSYPATGQPAGGLNEPAGVAVDGAGHIWVANIGANVSSISEFTAAGVPLSPSIETTPNGITYGGFQSTNSTLELVADVAIDPSGNVWMSDYQTGFLTVLIGAATPVITPLSAAVAAGTLATIP